ncbi:DUF4126 domain-containing protein [Plantibacter sp. Mn2098]|uniref:DUF4126 domain-containing protein n=1 Tax=Plantibacter sp. Mn2098 TaxID=3395266 RepID=UPI003BE30396
MLEVLTGAGLAAAAGVNAYIPLLVLGLIGRFTDLITLPAGWTWLENPWVLGILGFLLVLDVVADKIPAVDSLNDVVQTVIRPTAGGIAFGSGFGAETVAVQDPSVALDNGQWVPIVAGVVIALIIHLLKMGVRPVANAATAGFAAPVLSIAEDVGSLFASILALVVPVLVVLVAVTLAILGWRVLRKRRRRLANPA